MTRFLRSFRIAALLLVIPAVAAFADRPAAFALPDGPWEGGVVTTVDASTGGACFEYQERNPGKEAVLTLEFPDPGLEKYDALELEWKLAADDADVVVSLEGDHERPLRRYYLRKRPNPPGQWQKAFLRLNLDDDGSGASLEEAPAEGRMRLKIRVSLRDLEGRDNPQVSLRFARPRLVRYPVALTGSYLEVAPLEGEGKVGQRYTLTLHNRTDEPQRVHLAADTAHLAPFSLALPRLPIALAAGEEKRIQADVSVPAGEAAKLPPLTSGSAPVFAWPESDPDLKTTWFDSYFINPLIGSIPPPDRPAPRLVSEASRAGALEKIASEPKARELFEKMEREADEWLGREVAPPALIHGYSGHYVCKEHASPLQYRSAESHWCIKGKHLITDNPAINRAGAYQQHSALTHAALNLARVGWLKHEPRYSRKAADILLGYAAIYPKLPFARADSTGFLARVGHAVLGECWWFDPIPYAFDLVDGAGVLSGDETGRIRRQLLLPAILAIRAHRNAANQQAETNHAVALGALTAAHWPLASEAMDGEFGMRFQWQEDFDADGMSVEQELPYHFAAVLPFTRIALAYRAYGLHLFDDAFRKLFAAPIAYSPTPLSESYAAVYESILTAWPEPDFIAQAAQSRRRSWSWSALLSPVDPTDASAPVPTGNTTLPAGGTTVLRAPLPDGGSAAAAINFGSSAWRGGRALLDPLITWNGYPVNQRVLRIGYGYEGSKFSYSPAAGNALMVDGKGGSMLRADQEALLSDPAPAGRWTSPLHRPHFAGVRWSRTVALLGDAVLLLDQFSSEQPRRFDLISYFPAPFSGDISPASAYPALAGEGDGYAFFRNPQRLDAALPPLSYPLGPKANAPAGKALFEGNAAVTLTAEAQAGWHPAWIPVVIRRVEGRHGWNAIGYHSGEGEIAMKRLPVFSSDGQRKLPPHEAMAMEVISSDRRWIVLSTSHEETLKVNGEPLKGPLAIRPVPPTTSEH